MDGRELWRKSLTVVGSLVAATMRLTGLSGGSSGERRFVLTRAADVIKAITRSGSTLGRPRSLSWHECCNCEYVNPRCNLYKVEQLVAYACRVLVLDVVRRGVNVWRRK